MNDQAFSFVIISDRNLAINAVAARIEPNKKRGFTFLSFEMEAYNGVPDRSKITKTTSNAIEIIRNPQEQPQLMEDVIRYDTSVHQFQREEFVKQWCNPETTICLVAKKEGKVVGYGCIQPMMNNTAWHLGPVLADNPESGEILLNNLATNIPEGQLVALDIPLTNDISCQFVKKHAFVCDLKLTRMMNKAPYDIPVEKVFAITTLGVSLL